MDRSDCKTKVKMKIKALKSQVTMLMIVGIVMFMAIGLILYLSKTIIKKSGQALEKKIQTAALEPQPIKEFVASCLDKLSKDALVLLGKQGGYLYTSQGGTLIPFSDSDEGVFFIKNNGLNIVYNIKPIYLQVPLPYSTSIPEYPWATFPYGPINQNTKAFNGIFGINAMPPLNKSQGPHSIQAQIEAFIDSNMETCLDFSIFRNQGYDIQSSKSKTKVLIGARDVSIASEIPLKITNNNTQEKTELKDFLTVLDVRLSEMYYFAKEIIEKDVGQITFDIKDPANNKNYFNIKVTDNIHQKDDLISIEDGQSLVYGQPFEYAFGRKNMAPALYHIRNPVIVLPPNYIIYQEDILQDSELKAEDPDEDTPIITIKAQLSNPDLPTILDRPQIKFKIEANDGLLSDYQIITVNRR